MDDRVNQAILVTAKWDRLGVVLERLSKTTRVKLYASRQLADVPIACRYAGTLQGFMDALAEFFAVDREHKARWVHTETDRYWLLRGEEADDRLDALRKERREALTQGMDQAIRDENRWVMHLSMFTDAERRALYLGQPVAHHADHMGGQRFLDECLQRNARDWSGNVTVTYQMVGHSPLHRIFRRQFVDLEQGVTTTEGFALAQICPTLSPDVQRRDWQARYGNAAPFSSQSVAFRGKDDPKEGAAPRFEVLDRLAERASVNLIADGDLQPVTLAALPDSGPLGAFLDAVCAVSFEPREDGTLDPGCFWRKAGETYLVRSLAWPEEEL